MPLTRAFEHLFAGLKATKFETPTDIQRESLLLALQGHDILGAAKTGSGKTLAFLIPVGRIILLTFSLKQNIIETNMFSIQ